MTEPYVPALNAPAPDRDNPLLRSAAGVVGAAVLLLIVIACIGSLPWTLGWLGDSAAPFKAQQLNAQYTAPAWTFPDKTEDAPSYFFGSDNLGRSLFVRCLAGGGISIGMGIAAAIISVFIGVAYGIIAGYAGGKTDAIMMRIVDVLYGLPYILLVVLLAVAVDSIVRSRFQSGLSEGKQNAINVITLLVAIGGVSWLTMARVIRGQVLSLKEQPFIEAARAVGVPLPRLFLRHILPNLLGPIIVYATLTAPQAILQESFLSFLGIGVRPPLPSWGNLVADGLGELNTVEPRWWLLLFPSLLLGVTLLALNFVGEGLREAFDPKRARA